MASLAHTLALLAMTVATGANDVVLLDMALDSFDDQYRGCGPAMTAALPALNRSEFQKNPLFAQVWGKAAAEWQRRGPRDSPLSPEQAIAIITYAMDDVHSVFNDAVRVAGRSPQEYRDNFHFKTLHFLLTDALVTLRDALALIVQCQDVHQKVCGVRFEAKRGNTIRFGQFMPVSLIKPTAQCSGKETVFQVHTCHAMEITFISRHLTSWGVLIPPFETFEVTQVTETGDKTVIQLQSNGTYSKYNCEWLKDVAWPGPPMA
uniref:NAD(P)(+)--arginine ADP-ribosyltransferase n=1 Tax=Cyanoderma ruficeps TaxID=181631 RepID=A0A8C3R8I7_9PASS